MSRVVVLGAGPAGLGAALWAARRGFDVTVLEAGSSVGGLAGSFDVDGVRVDFGSHRLHPSIEPAILAELRALLGADLQLRVRNGRIRLGGRWVAFPLRAGDLVAHLPPGFLLGAARDGLLSPLRRPAGDTFADALRAGLGTTMCEGFYFPYARKIWGVEPELLSGEQARRRVSADSVTRLVRRVAAPGSPAGRVFWYPRAGYGLLWDRLAAAAVGCGAEIRLGSAVERLALEDRPCVTLADGASVTAEAVLSTIPLPVLARIAAPPVGSDLLAAAEALEFRAMTLVYLVLGTDRYTEFDAHYFPEAFTPVTRVSEPKNYRDGDDPPDRTVLCAEIPCRVGGGVWQSTGEELASIVARTLVASGLPDPAPLAVEIVRLPRAYPIYRTGFESAFRRLDAWCEGQERLLTFGRLGLFAHDNAHHALAMARDAVAALGDDGAIDRRAWTAARARFARHVVED